jgi:transposase
MDMHAAYQEVGSYRAAAEICGTTDKTVKRVVEAAQRVEALGSGGEVAVAHNYDRVSTIVAERVKRTSGRITAKRLLPVAVAAGYTGSARNFRRAVAEAKAEWRRDHHRGRRPGVWAPGDMLVFDWGEIGPLFVFCAVLAWSRFRFVFFADNLRADTTMAALALCMETIGGVPKTLLTDRMGCLKAGTVAGLVIPTPDYVRFVTHYGTRPDFCEGADPESKGIVEALVGYVKSDLMIPEELSADSTVTSGVPASERRWARSQAADGERQRFPVQTKSTVVMPSTLAQRRLEGSRSLPSSCRRLRQPTGSRVRDASTLLVERPGGMCLRDERFVNTRARLVALRLQVG